MSERPTAAGPGETIAYDDEDGRVVLWLGYPEHRTIAEIDAETRLKSLRCGGGQSRTA